MKKVIYIAIALVTIGILAALSIRLSIFDSNEDNEYTALSSWEYDETINGEDVGACRVRVVDKEGKYVVTYFNGDNVTNETCNLLREEAEKAYNDK